MSNCARFVDDFAEVIDYIQQRIFFVLKTVAMLIALVVVTAYAQPALSSGTGGPPTSVPGNPASIQVKGTVKVNPRALMDDTSRLFAGARMETPAGGAARHSAPRVSIYLPESSCLRYHGGTSRNVQLRSLAVNSHWPLWTHLGEPEITVSTTEANAAFAMSVLGKDFDVADQQGAIAIPRKGSVLSSMGSGSSRSFDDLGWAAAPNPLASEIGTAAALATAAVISKGARQK